jgi:hypothetical protein
MFAAHRALLVLQHKHCDYIIGPITHLDVRVMYHAFIYYDITTYLAFFTDSLS